MMTVMPVAILLNSFALFILARPRMLRLNISFLYIWQLLVNIFVAGGYIFLLHSRLVFGSHVVDQWCRLFVTIGFFLQYLSSWMVVVVALDRFLCVNYPTRFGFMREKKTMKVYLLIMLVFLGLVSSQRLFVSMRIDLTSNITIKLQLDTSFSCLDQIVLVDFVSDLITNLFRCLLPACLVLYLDIGIVIGLIRSKAKLNTSLKRREFQFTLCILASTLSFLCVQLPIAVCVMCIYTLKFLRVSVSDELLSVYFQTSVEISLLYVFFDFFNLLIINRTFRYEVLYFLRLRKPPTSQPTSI